MGVIRRFTFVLIAIVLCGCAYIRDLDTNAYIKFHESRWDTVVNACAFDTAETGMPLDPVTPRMCSSLESLYGEIIRQNNAVDEFWDRLNDQSQTSVQFVAEMLEVLVGRDTLNIEMLAPQIDEYATEHEELRKAWLAQRVRVDRDVAKLGDAWQTVWPDNGLAFDLQGDIRSAREEQQSPPEKVRRDALEHYHQNEYDRLAMIYLGFEPATVPQPKSHVPAGCDDLARALRHLEAGLLVRYSMDTAIEQDVERIQQLAAIDLSETPWEEIKLPRGRYARPKASAAIARLKLLKYLDTLLTDNLDILVGEVDRQWAAVWPGHGLETNIFAWAGLAEARDQDELPLPPTLRK